MTDDQPDSFMSDADSDFETEFGDWDDQRSIQTVFDDQPTKNRLSSLRVRYRFCLQVDVQTLMILLAFLVDTSTQVALRPKVQRR